MPMLRTTRDEQILEALVLKVRLLSLELVFRTWWTEGNSPAIHAYRRLTQLVNEGLLEQTKLLTEPLLDLTAPVFVWQPGQPAPDFQAVSYALQSRWTEPPRRTTVYVATTKAINQYGGTGSGGLKFRLQATHDLHVAVLYLKLLRTNQDAARAWVGEDLRPKAGFQLKDPDAVLEFQDGRPSLAIEFGGKYDAGRIQDFHEHCERFSVGYELW